MNFVEPIRDPGQLEDIENFLKERSERDWLLFVAGTNCGLRIGDLLQLRVRDVAGSHLEVKEQKTGKRRVSFITRRLARAFKQYTEGRPPGEYLFRSRKGHNQPISRCQAYRILRATAAAHGIERVGTHTLRKTFGYHFYRQTRDVAMLQEIFNHSSPEITLRYIGVNQALIDAAMAKFDPKAI